MLRPSLARVGLVCCTFGLVASELHRGGKGEKPAGRSLSDNAGYVTATLAHVEHEEACRKQCTNQTIGLWAKKKFGVPNCEAWQFTPATGDCELRQFTGEANNGILGDTSGVSWKRHSNFKGDCTPLWVDIAPKHTKTPMKTLGSQQQRDLACCRACNADSTCEAWVQGTDTDDKDSGTCWLRQLTFKDLKHPDRVAEIIGAGDRDTDYPTKKPKVYFSERRNMVCGDIKEKYHCGGNTSSKDECQSFGCCWDDNAKQCFRSNWRPVVIMHGMGSRLVEYEKNILWLRQAYPGIYVKNLNNYPGPPSMMTHMEPMQVRLTQSIQNDPMLQDGFNFYGESQGGLQARAFVTLTNDPPVYNLVAISGPQEGVGLCPTIDMPVLKQICADGAPIVDIYHWPKCSFCDYWHGLSEAKYLKSNQWLAALNNAHEKKDPAKAARMKSLNFYMASAGSDDKIVQPRESAWHTFWPWGGPQKESAVMDWRQTDGYKGDWLGLQTLDKQGKLEFNMYEGTHTAYNETWWKQVVLPVFNNKLTSLKSISTGNRQAYMYLV